MNFGIQRGPGYSQMPRQLYMCLHTHTIHIYKSISRSITVSIYNLHLFMMHKAGYTHL